MNKEINGKVNGITKNNHLQKDSMYNHMCIKEAKGESLHKWNNRNNNYINRSPNQNSKMIHYSTKRDFDERGNAIITTKIVREINLDNDKKNTNLNSYINSLNRNNNERFLTNNCNEDDNLRYSNNSNIEF